MFPMLAAALPPATAAAQDSSGWYAGVGAGTSHVEVYRGTLFGLETGTWLGVGMWEEGPGDSATLIYGGYRLSDHLALDLTYLAESDLGWREQGALIDGLPGYYDSRTTLSTSALQLSAVGILPFLNIWDAYLKGGVSWYRADARQTVADYYSGEELVRSIDLNDIGLLLGLGIGASFTDNWRVHLEYQFFWIDNALVNVEAEGDPTVDTWFFGVDYRFGSGRQR
jgi:opacity protein-like surface antigen